MTRNGRLNPQKRRKNKGCLEGRPLTSTAVTRRSHGYRMLRPQGQPRRRRNGDAQARRHWSAAELSMKSEMIIQTYGADTSGMVCGFRFTPESAGEPVDADLA